MTSNALAAKEFPAPTSVRRRVPRIDLWVCLAIALGGLFWASVAKPLSDPDIWWHVRTGDLILDQGIPHTEPWAYSALGRAWVPTAWLSDVALALLHDAFGWAGVIAFKLVAAAVLLIALGWLVFWVAPGPIGLAFFTLALLTLSPFLSERPQLLSLSLTVWLAREAYVALDGKLVSWWALPIVYLWANLHGMWVLVPVAMGVIALGLVIDHTTGWRAGVQRSLAVGVASVVLAALTPVGPRLAYWSLVVRDAADDISEWQPTTIADKFALAYLAVFLLWVLAVSQSTRQVKAAEKVWMFAMLLLGLQAGRNIAPTVILMVPFAANAMVRSSITGRIGSLPRLRVPPAIPALLVACSVALAGAIHVQRGSLVDGLPFKIVEELKGRPGTVRVINNYNVGGFLTGQGAPEISVAIDGRTDNYDPRFVDRYEQATERLVGWRSLIARLDPDAAVLRRGGQLAVELRRAGWILRQEDGNWLLLDPPAGAS